MLDFSRQYAALRQELLAAITAVCDSQRFILGPEVAGFEAAVAVACGPVGVQLHAIACASGTDALWLALAASGIGDCPGTPRSGGGDAVITSPFSFFATASSILRAGARPVFADIDPRTFNLSPSSVAEVLASPSGESIKAILPVHLYGQCADWDAFEQLRHDHRGLLLIEDAAQAFGATWTTPGQPPRPAGSLGDAAAFSFYPTKNLAAMGDAGLVTTCGAQIAARARSLRGHGMTRRYYHDEVGWNSRMDDLQAAVLNVRLRYIDQWNHQRRALAARYDQLFGEAGLVAESTADGVVLPYNDPSATPVLHQYVIRAPHRDALRAALAEQQIGSEIYYPVPIHLQAALKELGYKQGDFPEAERAAAEVLALPIYPELRDDEQQTVVAAIRRFYA